ncbi:hypothetical protein ABZS61_34430 [Streptomyces sp. NPDC005566]
MTIKGVLFDASGTLLRIESAQLWTLRQHHRVPVGGPSALCRQPFTLHP